MGNKLEFFLSVFEVFWIFKVIVYIGKINKCDLRGIESFFYVLNMFFDIVVVNSKFFGL